MKEILRGCSFSIIRERPRQLPPLKGIFFHAIHPSNIREKPHIPAPLPPAPPHNYIASQARLMGGEWLEKTVTQCLFVRGVLFFALLLCCELQQLMEMTLICFVNNSGVHQHAWTNDVWIVSHVGIICFQTF